MKWILSDKLNKLLPTLIITPLLSRYGNFVEARTKIEQEYAGKLRWIYIGNIDLNVEFNIQGYPCLKIRFIRFSNVSQMMCWFNTPVKCEESAGLKAQIEMNEFALSFFFIIKACSEVIDVVLETD